MSATTDTPIRIILATANRDKVRELRPLLENISPLFVVTSLSELGSEIEVEESEETLEGNALLKARAIFELMRERFPFFIALADDTGLEVDALGGAPGVHSARFAPVPSCRTPTYAENVQHLLHRLTGITDRSAHFRTVIALKGRIPSCNGSLSFEQCAEGSVSGSITLDKRGSDGFGYDPLFLVEGTGRTYGEMSIEEKNIISHRSLGVRNAIAELRKLLERNSIPLTGNQTSQ